MKSFHITQKNHTVKPAGTIGVSSTITRDFLRGNSEIRNDLIIQAPQLTTKEQLAIEPQFLPKRLRQKDPLIKDSLVTQVYRRRKRRIK